MHTTANQNFEKPMRQLDRQDQNTGKGNEGRLNNEGSGKIERSKKNKTAMTKPSGTQGNRKRSLSKSTKRTAAETDGQSPNKSTAVVDKDDLPARLNAVVSLDQAEEGIGEFEDAWEDEFEDEIGSEGHSVHFNPDDEEDENEDEDIIPGDGKELGQDEDDEQDGMAKDRSRSASPQAYLPHLHGNKLAEDEELVADPTAYKMLHSLSLTWPALSFDVLRDDLGEQRSRMPHSACIVAGTQAEMSGDVDQDEIMIMKWEGLSRMRKDPTLEDEDEEEDEEEDEDEVEEEPTLSFRTIPHKGSVNRVKAQSLPTPLSLRPPRPPDNYFAATFSGTGKVHIFDIAPQLYALQCPADAADQPMSKKPFHTINSHGRAEGFALSWGPANTNQTGGASLRLLTGDVHSKIFLTTSTKAGFTTNATPYTSHTSSVEDLQWSPSEPTVFASCSADQSLRIWDIRVKERKNVLGVSKAHPADVNVLSWNQSTSYLIVSGGDEGGLKVWDLRNLQSKNKQENRPVADFQYHKSAITSVEWNALEDSCFAASSADDQVTLWDLSVEVDAEEKKTMAKDNAQQPFPDQLLFSHQGQKEIKEVHWHPQIPGCVISTALDGLNVFKTISI
ncbi:ribosome biosynthesis protein rrb1 [Puccinia graminis f. sp. tritici]|uniref:Glutamate-rich WD repeat-containing protein 1 n=2 Tax=Puccinia graminis f. sp. tritici TaxID=56615 RepID=E3K6L6_PUCGT|nr:uncharacterized protein PGTG_05247 [Puccinia graminis f. sp. tritici CRL 75-36-700-3]EFP80022.1 hypothetical protein PGTG_05247 [Puccinia graminis f. sp. tritici CRL 75-36-700-3]KAA1110670.1 ribosome biosynthesis protein rrb1 [Puccinia graminis f. sp. tritici]